MAKFSKGNDPKRGDPVKAGKAVAKRGIMTEALMLALNEEVADIANSGVKTKRLRMIANKLAEKATEGDTQAIKEIFDRTEGKAAQAIIHQGDENNPIDHKWTVEFVNATPKGK